MKTPKIKRYRLGVSRYFPSTHARKGEPTGFVDFILAGDKIHTIRGNYELWAKRMAEVQAGRAIIELFYWTGKPYHKDENGVGQVVFATLGKEDGVGIQRIDLAEEFFKTNWIVGQAEFSDQLLSTVAQHDGLSLEDFKAWFEGYDLSEPMAIIHLTNFRY